MREADPEEAHPMQLKSYWQVLLFSTALFGGVPRADAGELTLSHGSTALPNAAGPAITLLSITGDNDGTNFRFTLKFANSTIEGPSSGKSDAVYGFINLDTDKNAATGFSGAYLDSNGFEPAFGRYSPGVLGVDAYINLGSEGDPLHGAPGLVDLVSTNGFNPIDTIPVSYSNAEGSTASTLSLTIPLTDFSSNQINVLDTGSFSVIVGNVNDPTDFLAPQASIPEPGAMVLLATGLSLAGLAVARTKRRVSVSSQCSRDVPST
jgi:hypothetical protein